MMSDRKGIVRVDVHYLDELAFLGTTKDTIFEDLFIYRANNCFMSNTVEYYAISRHFEPLIIGCIVPEYKYENGEWIKVEK